MAAIRAGYSEKSAYQQASNLMNIPEVLEYYEALKAQLYEDLRSAFIFDASQARKVMRDILDDGEAEDRDRLSAAKDFLDRAGFKATDKVQVDGAIPIVISGEEKLND